MAKVDIRSTIPGALRGIPSDVPPLMEAAAPPVEEAPPVTPPAPAPEDGHDLETCARRILAKLRPDIAEVVTEASFVFNRYPLWVTVAGLVLRAYENGEHTAPLLDPSWSRTFELPLVAGAASAACEYCSKEFKPRHYKQRFCGNECGVKGLAILEGKTA